ncbi:Stp1/IreP family PP2C-type Ser/Thr phosphatase [Paenibacillus turicensis]|uniref:Stp1/IreP family PP2C-type Ser/Thr phosphatase n=1 Tax=Paenibacillus turicensis TaxID=160487 RepID=UPI003D265767
MIRTVHVSDVGLVRSVNEDTAWTQQLGHGLTLGIVADGMGGHQAGDVASKLAVETIVTDLSEISNDVSLQECEIALKEAIIHANEVVYRRAQQHEEYRNMGTTVVAALLKGQAGIIGHIGDSRAYLYRQEKLEQLTEDHSLVNVLLKNKQISAAEASVHPRRNVLTRALGTDEEVMVDMDHITLELGDTLVICSDGLSNFVTTAQMIDTLGNTLLSLQSRADTLLQLALEAGGEDNITVVLIELGGDTEDTGSSTKELKA